MNGWAPEENTGYATFNIELGINHYMQPRYLKS